MGLKKEAQTILQKPFQQKSENILAATGLKVLIAIGFLAAFWLLRSYSVDLCLQNLQQETQTAKREIYRQVSSIQEHLEILADIIQQTGRPDSVRAKKILGAYGNTDTVSQLGIVLPDNQILQQDGTFASPINGITFDALAEKGAFITNIEQDNFNTYDSALFFNVPIVREGRTEGILFGEIELKEISELIEVDTFDGTSGLFIVDTQNMDFIMDTLHSGPENLHALQGQKIKKGYSKEQLMQDFSEGRGGLTAYFSKSTNDYLYTAYEPVGINDWFVMLTFPENTVLQEASYIKKVLLCLGAFEGILLLAYVWWDILRTRKELQQKERIATTDLLTNLKNRNAYEQVLKQYAADRPDCLSCVYADANGLHELNNSQGHLAGDKMLRSVADTLVETFCQGTVYRIGGDEFLVFTEADESTTEIKAQEAKERVAKAGYHVSVGTASGKKTAAVTDVVKEAEQKMYEYKRQYYMSQGDRRKMR